MPRQFRALLTIVFTMLVFAGCSGKDEGPKLYPVTGTVTLNGKPLQSGSIVLDPKDGKGKPVGGGIENGSFTLDAPLGEKIVRISAMKSTGKKDQYGEDVTESLIPEKFNRLSELTETVKESDNNFTFDLKSGKSK